MALAGLLSICLFFNIQRVSIYGDSKVMVDFVAGKSHINSLHLAAWLDRIRVLWRKMERCSIQQVDILSKEGLLLEPGIWNMKVKSGEEIFSIQDFSLPGS